MGVLHTIGWTTLDGEKNCIELVVPLENVCYAIAHTDSSGGPTTLLSMRQINPTLGGETIHVDVPVQEMSKILHRHSVDPSRKFWTHSLKPEKKVKKE